MTPDVHPQAAATWQMLVDRMLDETDERRRGNLELVARHVEAEVRGDLDALMATLDADPVYRYLGSTSTVAPRGTAAVRAWYAESVATGKNRLEFAVDRVVVDEDCVVTEGVFRHAYQGQALLGRGSDAGTITHPDRWYLVEYRSLVVWPVTERGLLAGEDVYIGEPARVVRQLAEDEAPHLGPVERCSVT